MTHTHMSDVLAAELERLSNRVGRVSLDILETGSIRNATEPHRVGDGWSTLTLATYRATYGGRFVSVDLDTSQAKKVLAREQIAGVELVQAESVATLKECLAAGMSFDFILLDSGDDPELIYAEYEVARQLVRVPGLIAVDDVAYHPGSYGSKGERVVPHLEAEGIDFRVSSRWGGGGNIDVVLIDY